MSISFKNMLRKMAPDFGVIKEEFTGLQGLTTNDTASTDAAAKTKERAAIEKNVLNQLDRSTKLDKVDTVTFGLETDDSKIVKVYVNAEQAEEFEKELSVKLGEVDDIEEVLNELSKKFEIVDVEWPEDEKDGDDDSSSETDVDQESEEPDGSEAMDPRVHKRKDVTEASSYGDRVTLELSESMSNIEQRLTSPSQLLIYQAILQLGLPEIVMTKSPYRSTIITSIKHAATELNKNSSLKTALKMFVRRATEHGHDEPEQQHRGKENHHTKSHDDKPAAKVVKEDVNDDSNPFWDDVRKILTHVSSNQSSLTQLLNSVPWGRLIARSEVGLTSKFNSTAKSKLDGLAAALPTVAEGKVLKESISVDELTGLLQALFEFADPSEDKSLSQQLMSSSQFKQFMSSAKSTLTEKFSGVARNKMDSLMSFLNAGKPQSAAVSEGLTADDGKWGFSAGDDGFVITHGDHLTITLDDENLELLAKGIANKKAVVVASDDKKRYSFSPRGVIIKVKLSGDNESCEMGSEDVKKLQGAINDATADEKKNSVVTDTKGDGVTVSQKDFKD